MKTLSVSCYNCNSSASEHYDSENGFTYVKCSNCGLIYLNPRPANEEITAAHEIGMHRGEAAIKVTGRYKKSKIMRYYRILLDFYSSDELQSKNLKWFDIGCGFGEFMESLLMINKNIIVKGSEFNKQKIQACKSRNLDVSFIELDSHSEKYDIISLLNVFSHLPNPVEFLDKVKKNLLPGGEIFLETGHTCHLPAKYHQKPYYAPDHLSFANKEIVEGILVKLGFDIVKTKVYRSVNFPIFYDIKGIVLQLAKIVLKKGTWRNFFPKDPIQDMYVRAKLKH